MRSAVSDLAPADPLEGASQAPQRVVALRTAFVHTGRAKWRIMKGNRLGEAKGRRTVWEGGDPQKAMYKRASCVAAKTTT